jgi:hypothetical protein
MTQAMNLANFSNSLDSSGGVPPTQLNAAVPISKGGTGQATQQLGLNALAGAVTTGQYLRGNGTNVVMSAIQVADVPTLNQNSTGSAGSLVSTNFSIVESGGNLLIKYGATTIVTITSSGAITAGGSVTGS